jgi:hypothetical protein
MVLRKPWLTAFLVLLFVLWPLSALAATTTASTPTACDQFHSSVGFSGGSFGPLLVTQVSGTAPATTGVADIVNPITFTPAGTGPASFTFAPAISATLPSGGTNATFCLPSATSTGDVVATLDYSPANPSTTNAGFGNNFHNVGFGIEVLDATTGATLTEWVPGQCHPGHDIFTLSGSQLHFNGPFLLRFFNFTPDNVSFTMSMAGPGAEGIPGANTATFNTQQTC